MDSNSVHESSTAPLISENLKFGYFWHFLATFGIENGSMITLPIFGVFKFAKIMYDVRVDIMKLKITWPLGAFFTF